MKEIKINGLSVELEKKRIKNMYLKILPPDGRIYIVAPLRMKEADIKYFVLTKLDWIEKKQQKYRQSNQPNVISYVNDDVIPVRGKQLILTVLETEGRNRIEADDTKLYMKIKADTTLIQREKLLNDWYKQLLLQEVPELIPVWEKIIGVKSSGFHIRKMKTRWGSCNINTKGLCFNLLLATKAPPCLEYVVVHELVHLREKSHNHIFKAYMDQFLPDWRNRKKLLNSSI